MYVRKGRDDEDDDDDDNDDVSPVAILFIITRLPGEQ